MGELRPLKRLFYYSYVRGLRNDMLKLDFFLLNFVRLNLNHSNNTLFKRQVLNKDLNYKFKYCPIKIKNLNKITRLLLFSLFIKNTLNHIYITCSMNYLNNVFRREDPMKLIT